MARKSALENGVFRNKMFEFPKPVLKDIEKLALENGYKGAAIHTWLKQNAKPSWPKIPTIPTITAYVSHILSRAEANKEKTSKVRQSVSITETELRNLMDELDLRNADPEDGRNMMHLICKYLQIRVELMTKIQDDLWSPKYEQVIIEQLRLITDCIEKVWKLDGQRAFWEFNTRLLMAKTFENMAGIFSRASEKVYGREKQKEFLDEALKEFNQFKDWKQMYKDAYEEASRISKEGGVVPEGYDRDKDDEI